MIAALPILVTPAQNAGIKLPDSLDEYDAEKYPHWHLYSLMQLGRPLPSPDSHWNNAKRIASLSDEEVLKITYFKADSILE